jgi:hypothetical protein
LSSKEWAAEVSGGELDPSSLRGEVELGVIGGRGHGRGRRLGRRIITGTEEISGIE